MKPFDYIAEAHVTASGSFHGDKVPFEFAADAIENSALVLQRLDKVKKTLFYGRELGVTNIGQAAADSSGFVEVIKLASKGAIPEEGGLTDEQATNLLHGVIGAATEVGEMLEHLYDILVHGKALDAVNMVEEMGDAFWYFALIARSIGTTFDSAQRINIQKLRFRYKDKFEEFDANNRDLFIERKVLEANSITGSKVETPKFDVAMGSGILPVRTIGEHIEDIVKTSGAGRLEK